MHLRKTPLVLTITSAAVLALAGCSGTSAASSSSGSADDTSITLITGNVGAYYGAMVCGAKKEATALGATVTAQQPQTWDPTKSESLIRAATVKQPDGMIVVPTDATALDSALSSAKQAGVKIVAADQTVSDPSLVNSTVVTDNVAAGAAAADAMATAINKTGKVVIDGASVGSSAALDRVKGFKDRIASTYPNITVVGTQYSQSDTQKASNIVTGTLAKHPDLAGVYTIYEVGAIGIGSAIKSAGLTGKVKLVGFDTAPSIVSMLKSGIVTATVAQQPAVMGEEAVKAIVAARQGKTVKATTSVPFEVITKSNLTAASSQEIVQASEDHC